MPAGPKYAELPFRLFLVTFLVLCSLPGSLTAGEAGEAAVSDTGGIAADVAAADAIIPDAGGIADASAAPDPAPDADAGTADTGATPGNGESGGGIRILVDGRLMEDAEPPQTENGRLLIPLRSVGEYLGARINWNPAEQRVIGFRGARGFDLIIGSATANLSDGRTRTLDAAAKLTEGRTYVPLRFVSEAMGCQVSWDEAARTVNITTFPADAEKEVRELAAPIVLQVLTDKGSGSAFFYSKDGQVITAARLIDGAARVRLKTAEGKEYAAEVLIKDSVLGLAKLRLVRAPGEVFPVFRYFDDFAGIVSGEKVFALGSPLPAEEMLTAGLIAAKTPEDEESGAAAKVTVTAGISAKNHGGPLVRENGALIGVNCLGEEGSGAYVIPVDYIFQMRNR